MAGKSDTVLVGLSGGVDSAVAAVLLLEQGYQVVGITLSLWHAAKDEYKQNGSHASTYRDVEKLSEFLKIPWIIIDQVKDFREKVVGYYLENLKQGGTPNPCIICNKLIKWSALLEAVEQNDARYLATGHYARRHNNQTIKLMKAKDPKKDQSYFLAILGQKELGRTLFPLGEYTKEEVRSIAKARGLPVTDRRESQDLCFLGGMKQNEFIYKYAPELIREGDITLVNGKLLGRHAGLVNYTIGQRKGIRIAHPNALYVVSKDYHNNRLIVGEKELLGRNSLVVGGLNWISGYPPRNKFQAKFMIRYHSIERDGEFELKPDGKLEVKSKQTIRDITPGQALVMYQQDTCLGMGFIE
jgi:tRNA-specific 2-thiouridylase